MNERLSEAQKFALNLLAIPEICGSISLSELWRLELRYLITSSDVITLMRDLEQRGLVARQVIALEPGEIDTDPTWGLTPLGQLAVALNRQYSRQEIKEVS